MTAAKKGSQGAKRRERPKLTNGGKSSGTPQTRNTRSITDEAKRNRGPLPKREKEATLAGIITSLISRRDPAEAKARLIAEGKSKQTAASLVKEAQKRIALAADHDLKEELGRARIQLDELFDSALLNGDLKTALATRKELSKILHLYEGSAASALDTDLQTATEALVREHLEGLEVTEKGLPLEELARNIALYVIQNVDE